MNLSASMNDAGDGFELLMSGNMQDFNICCRRDNHYPEHKLIPLLPEQPGELKLFKKGKVLLKIKSLIHRRQL